MKLQLHQVKLQCNRWQKNITLKKDIFYDLYINSGEKSRKDKIIYIGNERRIYMNRKLKSIICMLLCVTMIIPAQFNTFAYAPINIDGVNYQNSKDFLLLSEEEQDEVVEDFINNMSPKAQAVLSEYFQKEEPELYEHYEGVLPSTVNNRTDNNKVSIRADKQMASIANSSAMTMQTLGNALRSMALPQQVYTVLMGAGAELAALSVTITPAAVVGVLLAAGVTYIIVTNWSSINWSRITTAFQKAFSKNSSSIAQGFGQAKTNFSQQSDDIKNTLNRYRGANVLSSAGKHIDATFVKDFIRNSQNKELKVFYSSKNRISMIVLKVKKGTTASINKTLSSTQKYELPDFNIGGYTMYLLYDCKANTIFHCHVRLVGDDTNEMRRANGLDWMLYPEQKREIKYNLIKTELKLNPNQVPPSDWPK